MGKELITIEQIIAMLDDTKKFNTEYYINGKGLDTGCCGVHCSVCCFNDLQDISNCFNIMSSVSGEDVYHPTSVKEFAKYLKEKLEEFWRL